MAKRRGNQEGAIYQKANGKWRAQIMLDGGRLSCTCDTRKEAQEWLRATRNQIESGLTLKGAKTPYGEFLAEWLATAKQRLSISSHYSYSQLAKTYIRPVLGTIKLRDLNPSSIQRFYNQKVAEGVGLRSAENPHGHPRFA